LSAVCSNNVCTRSGQLLDRLLWGGSHHRSIFVLSGIEHHTSRDGQPGCLCRFDCQNRLGGVAHCFDDDSVRLFGGNCFGLFQKRCIEFVRRCRARHEHHARRSDRGKNPAILRLGNLFGKPHTGAVQFGDLVSSTMLGEQQSICPKSVREDNVTPGLDVCRCNFLNFIGMRQIPKVRMFANGKSTQLQLRTPTAIKDKCTGCKPI
jgi:hypothetical protein